MSKPKEKAHSSCQRPDSSHWMFPSNPRRVELDVAREVSGEGIGKAPSALSKDTMLPQLHICDKAHLCLAAIDPYVSCAISQSRTALIPGQGFT